MAEGTDKKQYRNIRESQGGTLVFRQAHSENSPKKADPQKFIQRAGTWNCYTCTGVYFAIGDRRCFLAHINPYLPTNSYPFNTKFLTEDQGQQLKKAVIDRLKWVSDADGWTPAEVRKDTLVMVCPMYNDTQPEEGTDQVKKQSGVYVAEAIADFLEISSEVEVDAKSTGFIIEYTTRAVTKLVWDLKRFQEFELPIGLEGYKQKDEYAATDGMKTWFFLLTP